MVYRENKLESLKEMAMEADKPTSSSITTTTTIKQRLHNFNFPGLKWGNQKVLRCKPTDSTDRHRSSPPFTSDSRRAKKPNPGIECVDVEGVRAVGEKLISDLKEEANKMKEEIFTKEGIDMDLPLRGLIDNEKEVTWNLRKRKSVKPLMKGNSVTIDKNHPSLVRSETCKSPSRVREEKETERRKFSVPLSKNEIEDDFMAMVGHRPRRRPKKRPRTVQKDLDFVFPGLFLTEVTPEMYD